MPEQIADLQVVANTLWVMVAAFLVFWMNAGFACVESGFCRAKNTVNIMSKNFIVFAIASIAFWAVGWTFMFGEGNWFIGWKGFFVSGADNSPATGDAYQGVYASISWAQVPLLAKFFFQLVFAATAATIVSGAVAERIKFHAFIIFSFVLVGIMYPITGHWIWGGGLLASSAEAGRAGFWDFAGSTAVHSVGGWAALAGAIVLGPRLGKFRRDGTVQAIPGHNIALATLGGLILWLGWFGFNPGSTMAADGAAIAHIATTTNLAAAAGVLTACATSWIFLRKPDQSMIINGGLAGLVAITCPCAWVTPTAAVVIGGVAGIGVVAAVLFFDKIRIDDPVGALSVHLVNGIWGTLSLGLFAVLGTDAAGLDGPKPGLFYGGTASQLLLQLKGVGLIGLFGFFGSLLAWGAIRATVGMRVSPDEEVEGLDIGEMGMEAYPAEPAIDVETLLRDSYVSGLASVLRGFGIGKSKHRQPGSRLAP